MSRRGRSRGPRKESGTGNSEEDDLGADDVADDAVATLQAEIAASVAAADKREADALAREKKREEEALTREQAQTARLEQMMAKQAESMVRMIQLTIESSAKEAQGARTTAADREAVERAAAIAAVEDQTRRAAAAGVANVAAPAPASSTNASFSDLPRGDQKRLWRGSQLWRARSHAASRRPSWPPQLAAVYKCLRHDSVRQLPCCMRRTRYRGAPLDATSRACPLYRSLEGVRKCRLYRRITRRQQRGRGG